jgi:hypothetical protein
MTTTSESNGNHLIPYEQDGIRYKICRIFFGRDGTYYVTSPYHPLKKAIQFKATVNYDLDESIISADEFIDSAEFDDEEGRIKLAHHPDGYLQFSGQGVLSGKTPDGDIKGIGVWSWKLERPASGPAFVVAINGVSSFERATETTDQVCEFSSSRLSLFPEPRTLILEGHYFPPLHRRFIRPSALGEPEIAVVHPTGKVLFLRTILPAAHCKIQGFLGLELYSIPRVTGSEVGFHLSGATGNVRTNEKKHKLADGIFCMYPREFDGHRSLHWPPR